MAVDRDDLLKVKELAELELSDAEVDALTRDCRLILQAFDSIMELDISTVEPADALEHAAPLREDAENCDPLELPPAEMAPKWRDGFYVLPRLAALDDAAGPAEE